MLEVDLSQLKSADKATKVEMPLAMVDELLLTKLSEIPDKMAFKIGEVADLLGLKQYVLRYWETEFDELKPKKSGNNQRMYSRKNVETALLIQKLLHRDRFSIEGAKKMLSGKGLDIKRNLEVKQISKDLFQVSRELKNLVKELEDLKQIF